MNSNSIKHKQHYQAPMTMSQLTFYFKVAAMKWKLSRIDGVWSLEAIVEILEIFWQSNTSIKL